MHKGTLHNRGDNKTYRKKENSEGKYLWGQVAGNNTGQYTKSNWKKNW